MFVGLLALALCTQAMAQTLPACTPVSPYDASVCLGWPDPQKFKAPYRMVAMVPGCDGFDGMGYDGKLSARRQGESDADFKHRVTQRVAEFRKGLVQQYAERTKSFLDRGMGVVRIDFTQLEPRSAAKSPTNCSHAINPDTLKNVATRLGEGLALVRSQHRTKVKDQDFYVVASSLGAGGVLQLFKSWSSRPAAQRPNRAVIYFPACRDDVQRWMAPIPTLLLMGRKDNVPVALNEAQGRFIGLAENCRAQAQTAGARLELREYDDTYHGFSVPGSTEPMHSVIPTNPPYPFVAFAYNPKAAAEASKALLDKLK
jgi:dienelactone hydrolase